jgi:hypothetical protein
VALGAHAVGQCKPVALQVTKRYLRRHERRRHQVTCRQLLSPLSRCANASPLSIPANGWDERLSAVSFERRSSRLAYDDKRTPRHAGPPCR